MLRSAALAAAAALAATVLAQPAPAQNFTTADEVRPILEMTRASWIAVREFDGMDLLYFTQIAAWRCGIAAATFVLDGAPEAEFEMEPCYHDTPQPNAIRGEPFLRLPLGSVQKIRVTVHYEDGSTDAAEFTRAQIAMN